MQKRLMITGLLGAALMAAMVPGVASAAQAKTKDACKHGGWMDLVDESNVHFPSEKACKEFAKDGGTPMPPATIVAIAYTNLGGTDGYEADQDVLIAKFVDDDGTPGPSAGDHIVMGQYPTTFTPTVPTDFADFEVPSHEVTAVDAYHHLHGANLTARTSLGATHTWEIFRDAHAGVDQASYREAFQPGDSALLLDGTIFAYDFFDIDSGAPSRPTVGRQAERFSNADDAFLNIVID